MKEKLNKIVNQDCLEYLKELPNGCVDCIVTDPPYCIGTTSNGHKGSYNDNNLIKPFFEILFAEFKRILKDGSEFYINTDWRTYPFLYPIILKYLNIKNCIVWDYEWIKAGSSYRFTHEFIIYGFIGEKYERKFNANESDVWRLKCVNFTQARFHQAQKPTELVKKMLINSTKENDIILDCFMGSGTTAISCIENNRQFLGCEIDEKYFEIANNRIKDFYNNKQNSLFDL